MTDQQHDDDYKAVDAERITIGVKIVGGILLHAIMLVIFFMSLKSAGEKNTDAINRHTTEIEQIRTDHNLAIARIDAQLATINVRLAVLENQNAQRNQK